MADFTTMHKQRSRTISSSSSISVPSSPRTALHGGTFDFLGSDVEELFKVHSVEEIKDAEKKIMGEIEKKKEDLRSMVGERYRDLIDAADTIKDMGQVIDQVFKGILGMQKSCNDFEMEETIRLSKMSVEEEVKNEKETNFYALATQMELLVDTPEKIWSALDRHEYLMAAQLYLLADHIVNDSLKIKAKQGRKDVFAKFPILHHQWAAISHFKASILKDTRASLKDVTLPDKELSESLCSIILLENSSVREAFMEFLLTRKSAIQDVFHPRQHTTSVKSQVCNVARLIHLTILQTFNLFMVPFDKTSNSEELNIFINRTLTNVIAGNTSTTEGGALQDLFGEDFDVLTVARHLPSTVLGFRPRLRTANLTIPLQNIQNNTKEWLIRCGEEVRGEVRKLLNFVKTVKGIASVRDAVYDLLRNFEENRPESMQWDYEERAYWDTISEAVLAEKKSIWQYFFRDVFLERIQAILDAEFDKISSKVEKSVTVYLDKLSNSEIDGAVDSEVRWDQDVGEYLWSDSSDTALVPAVDDRRPNRRSALIMKAKSQTTSAVRICSELDSLILKVIEDVSCYTNPDQQDSAGLQKIGIQREMQMSLRKNGIEPFDKLLDAKQIVEYCTLAAEKLVNRIRALIQLQIGNLQIELSNLQLDAGATSLTLINRILFLGRLSCCIPENCSNLVNSLIRPEQAASSRTLQRSKFASKTENIDVSTEVLLELLQLNKEAVSIWKTWIAKQVGNLFHESLFNEDVMITFGTTGWEEITIQEETESGQPVHSKIRVPSQISFTLSSLLFRLTEEINRIGGQILDRASLKRLTLDVGHQFCDVWSTFLENDDHLWQERCLQLMFDIKFLQSLLTGTSDTKDADLLKLRSRAVNLIEKLEQFIDPFDLDVFQPHLNTYVTRQLQRSWLLLGTLSATERHPVHAFGQRLSLSSQEQHSVLPVNPNPVRFILLPVPPPSEKGLQKPVDVKGGIIETSSDNRMSKNNFPLEHHGRLCSF